MPLPFGHAAAFGVRDTALLLAPQLFPSLMGLKLNTPNGERSNLWRKATSLSAGNHATDRAGAAVDLAPIAAAASRGARHYHSSSHPTISRRKKSIGTNKLKTRAVSPGVPFVMT
jgi:hypothetical protein